jgi:hypothetical protein
MLAPSASQEESIVARYTIAGQDFDRPEQVWELVVGAKTPVEFMTDYCEQHWDAVIAAAVKLYVTQLPEMFPDDDDLVSPLTMFSLAQALEDHITGSGE